MRNLVLASSGSVHGSEYLAYLLPTIDKLYKDIEEVLFIPYAQPSGISLDDYTDLVQQAFGSLGIEIKGLHEFEDSRAAIKNAKGIFVGGGNTFLLVSKLYCSGLWEVLKEAINKGTPYLGTSAGTNIVGLSMQTTNDMPIVLPPSYKTLGIVPFNFNVHYLEPSKKSKHKGETRAVRIKEFQCIENTKVLGLKEGSWLRVKGDDVFLRGGKKAFWFEKGEVLKLEPNTNLGKQKS
ncbi:dipeptidase PepE [Wenyingzhuangia aestuarii]|uniref:dipeptidase PepE n=1 Tax=Wenyingzhuangia aestuarii TaxID=1647582 RepID=UPI00143A1B4C|nr:dipeptidase PepE [Wenyingzhuangia aestuarii]NJB81787.1 dipeptidase E [Wenyingzhuangia aestuarii]